MDTSPRDRDVSVVLEAIRTGGKKQKLKGSITQIRNRFEAELAITGDYKEAKLAVDPLKKQQLPAVTWSGTFTQRANDMLIQHSGLLCADFDGLNSALVDIRDKLTTSPHLFGLFISPSGDGLKAVFRVLADASKHAGSFRAVQSHVRELCGVEIDQSGKDVARLCFMSYDPEIYVNENAIEIEPLSEPEKPKRTFNGDCAVNLSERQRIAGELLGAIDWQSETSGFLPCPGKDLHTTATGERDCQIDFDSVPTVHCFHNSCRGILAGINHELRSRIGKAEYAKPETPGVEASDTAEPRSALAPYVPPPLTLLPQVPQEYVHAAAQALNVDVAYILLPLLSSLGAAIGNARSVMLKRLFIQPPNIWSAIIARSGSRKSPAIERACFVISEHERELDRQNREAREIFSERLAQWEAANKKTRGEKPQPPVIQTCQMDDLTLESLADRLVSNTRGVLVPKDELSHWFESFDQYRNQKGSDVSRWCSLHTGVQFGIDRRTDNRHQRIWLPRVCITGGIQPKVLKRLLTEDFFERGLPARFIFAAPPFRQDRWTDATIPDDLMQAVRELFENLWLLQPGKDEHDQPAPVLLRLSGEAREPYIAFYNECGVTGAESNDHEAAAWSKLTGYAARFALIGQVLHDTTAEKITGDTMQAACDLARWFGNEAARIYAELAEPQEQREQRALCEFIERRGGAVYEREVMQSFTRLKNDKLGTERELTALVKAGLGQWEPVEHGGGPGRPARKFHILRLSTSTQFSISRWKTGDSVDVDGPNIQKNEGISEPENVAIPENASDWPEGVRVENGKVIL